jgi:hypothetical protein
MQSSVLRCFLLLAVTGLLFVFLGVISRAIPINAVQRVEVLFFRDGWKSHLSAILKPVLAEVVIVFPESKNHDVFVPALKFFSQSWRDFFWKKTAGITGVRPSPSQTGGGCLRARRVHKTRDRSIYQSVESEVWFLRGGEYLYAHDYLDIFGWYFSDIGDDYRNGEVFQLTKDFIFFLLSFDIPYGVKSRFEPSSILYGQRLSRGVSRILGSDSGFLSSFGGMLVLASLVTSESGIERQDKHSPPTDAERLFLQPKAQLVESIMLALIGGCLLFWGMDHTRPLPFFVGFALVSLSAMLFLNSLNVGGDQVQGGKDCANVSVNFLGGRNEISRNVAHI